MLLSTAKFKLDAVSPIGFPYIAVGFPKPYKFCVYWLMSGGTVYVTDDDVAETILAFMPQTVILLLEGLVSTNPNPLKVRLAPPK